MAEVHGQERAWQASRAEGTPFGAPGTRTANDQEAKAAKLFGLNPRTVHMCGGQDKKIIISSGLGSHRGVYILPQEHVLNQRERNIRKEIAFTRAIEADLQTAGKTGETHLATQVKELKPGLWIMAKAEKENLEEKMQRADFTTRVRYGSEFLQGMENLHSIDRVHGDMKPENVLIFGSTVRVADFGKGTVLSQDKAVGSYTGNTRFGPPEGKLSKASDIFSAGLCLIRVLEEEFLDESGKPLVDAETKPTKENPTGIEKIPAHKSRRGVERFIVEDKDFERTCETKGTGWKGFIKNLTCRIRSKLGFSETELKPEGGKLQQYIAVLANKIHDAHPEIDTKKLINLLEGMTALSPSNRISMEEARKTYNELFGLSR